MSHLKILILVFISFAGAMHAQNILEYRCSDSVYQSRLSISHTGLVTINESCFDACPLHTYEKNYNLSGAQLLELLNIINATRSGQLEKREGPINNLITCAGALSVLGETGQRIIKKIEIPFSNRGIFTFNTSPASLELEEWVTRQVKQKIASKVPADSRN